MGDMGGGGGQKSQKSAWRTLWMATNADIMLIMFRLQQKFDIIIVYDLLF